MDKSKTTPESTLSRRKYKRRIRNIIIHKPMQREFILILIALLMVSSLAVGFVIHDTIREAALGGGFRFGKINPYEVLSEVRYHLIVRVTSILFVTLIVIGIFAVFFLHRVAGPVYRFRQVFLKLNEGEVPHRIKLREGDFFEEAAVEINQFVDRWKFENHRMEQIKEKIDQLTTAKSGQNMSKTVEEVKAIIEQQPKL